MTALYELSLRDGFSRDDVLGTVRLRWTEPGASRESSLAQEITTGDLAARFREADPTLRLDAVVAATAAILRSEDGPRVSDLRDIVDVVREDGDLPATDQVHDFVDLLERMADLRD